MTEKNDFLLPDWSGIVEYYKKNRPDQKKSTNIEKITSLISSWRHFRQYYEPEFLQQSLKDIETDALGWALANERRYKAFEKNLKDVCELAGIKEVPDVLLNFER